MKFNKIAGLSCVLAAATLFAPVAHAAELLGCRSVGFINDRDTIGVGRADGRFRAIQLRVTGNDINMRDLKVVYGNGSVDDLAVRSDIRAGGETRWIDLKGERRAIRAINMTYASRPNFRGQANVCVYGR
jgi:hypothetical protein